MRLRKVVIHQQTGVQIAVTDGWVNLNELLDKLPSLQIRTDDILSILQLNDQEKKTLLSAAQTQPVNKERIQKVLLPFQPLSFRDFMIYEQHVIAASRGFAKKFFAAVFPITRFYETVTGKPFPAFKPKALWYKQPIYYMSNHLAFVADETTITWPSYSNVLDYELELGFILTKPLYNATPTEAEQAIGGFVVLNDVSARDVQLAEMNSGFGPQKAKHFLNVMGSEVISAEEILTSWQTLTGQVTINGKKVADVSAHGARYNLGQMLAHVSKSEHLYPGEFFGTGTLPGGSGMENGSLVKPGDMLELTLNGIGSMKCKISETKS